MFPSSQTGSGINSSFGLVPISGRSSSGSIDETRNLAFNWLGHLTGHGVGLFDEQQSGLKVTSDQIMDRSFMSIDRHTPSVPRRTPHSSVSGSSGQPGADAPPPPHPIQDASMVNTFHPYRLVGDGLSAAGHPTLSTSQFAAFDSLYKAYQGAYGSATPGSVFGTQPFRFDSPLLADQRMMLQASLLQYPHLGIFPNPALYPGLPGTGVRYPSEYYGQNLPSMSLSSKYPDVGGPSWLGLERTLPLMDREKETKDVDRKNDIDLSKRSDKDEHHRNRSEREDISLVRRDSKDDGRRCEDGRREPMKHVNEKKDQQQKRSNSLKSPIRQEGHHHSSSQDGGLNRCNSGGPSDFSCNSGRIGHVMSSYGMSADMSSLPKVSSSPGVATSQQRQTVSRNDRTTEPVQDHTRAKDRHHHHHHHHHHQQHNWKADEGKTKVTPPVLTVPKTTASVSTNGQQSKPFEKKFHRPFEQNQMNSLAVEKPDRTSVHLQKDMTAKNICGLSSSEYLARSTDGKMNDSYRFLHHQQYQQQQQQQRGKAFETKTHPHTSVVKKQGSSGAMRCEEAPLNLVMTKNQNLSSGSTIAPTPTDLELSSSDCFEVPRAHRAPQQSLVPPPHTNPEVGFHAQTWGLACSDDVRIIPRQEDGVPNNNTAIITAPAKSSPPVSKLDMEIERRVKLRKTEGYNAEEEEEEEDDEDVLDNSKDVARMLLISSGPPLKEPATVAKWNYLSMFGLVPLESSKGFAFEQRRKRCKLFHERSISPVLIDDSEKPESDYAKLSLRNEISHLDKHSFLSLLDLESVRSRTRKRKVASQSDREDVGESYRRPGSSHLNESGLNTLQNQHVPVRLANNQYTFPASSQLDQKPPELRHPGEDSSGSSLGVTSFDPLSERRPFADMSTAAFSGGEDVDRWLNVDGDPQLLCDAKRVDPARCQSDAQTVHGHVQDNCRQVIGGFPLLSSTNDGQFVRDGPPQESSPFNVSSRNASTPSSASREVTNCQIFRTTDHQCRESSFHWPGLEAVIESYHHYVEEQAMEKQLLREQSQRLRHHNADLMFTAERFRNRMSELLHSKQQLIEERLKAQSHVDGLKDVLKQFL